MNTTDPSSLEGGYSDVGERHVEPMLISVEELSQIMQVSVRTLWRLRSAGRLIEPIRIGRNTRWRLDEVRRWIDEGCPAPPLRDD